MKKIGIIIVCIITIFVIFLVKFYYIDNNAKTVVKRLNDKVESFNEKDVNKLIEEKDFDKASEILIAYAIKNNRDKITDEDLKGRSAISQLKSTYKATKNSLKLSQKIKNILDKHYPDNEFRVFYYKNNLAVLDDIAGKTDIIVSLGKIYNDLNDCEKEYVRKYCDGYKYMEELDEGIFDFY